MSSAAEPVPVAAELLARFREQVESSGGLLVDESREDALREAVSRLAAARGLGAEELLEACASDPAILEDLVGRVSVGETYFFRNRPHFAALREVILPEILADAAGRRRVCLWSAGCSSGEEAYSLAMVLGDVADASGLDREAWSLEVLATDIDAEALERARAATYGEYSFRGVSTEEKARYFETSDGGRRVRRPWRDLVTFRHLNLKRLLDPDGERAFSDLDLIVCRNVTIYFTSETTRALAERFHGYLRPGGYLIVGHSEHSLETYRRFETHALPDAILYRRGVGRPAEGAPLERSPLPLSSTPARRTVTSLPRLRRLGALDVPVGVGPRAPTIREVPDRPSLDQARSALSEGDVDGAVAVAVGVLEHDPADADACVLLGELAADRGHAAEARIWLRRTLDLRPLDLTAHHVLAVLDAEAGEVQAALEHVRRALYVEPDFIMGHYLAWRLEGLAGREEAAARARRTLVSVLDGLDDGELVPFSEGLTVGQFRGLIERLGR